MSSSWYLILYFPFPDSRFPEWLEAGDPLHRRKWPVSVLQWPCELWVLNHEGYFRMRVYCRGTVELAVQHRALSWYHPSKVDHSPEQNNKALRTTPRLFHCVSARWGRTRFPFLANSVSLQNKSTLHEAKNRSEVNSASASPTSLLLFCLHFLVLSLGSIFVPL